MFARDKIRLKAAHRKWSTPVDRTCKLRNCGDISSYSRGFLWGNEKMELFYCHQSDHAAEIHVLARAACHCQPDAVWFSNSLTIELINKCWGPQNSIYPSFKCVAIVLNGHHCRVSTELFRQRRDLKWVCNGSESSSSWILLNTSPTVGRFEWNTVCILWGLEKLSPQIPTCKAVF